MFKVLKVFETLNSKKCSRHCSHIPDICPFFSTYAICSHCLTTGCLHFSTDLPRGDKYWVKVGWVRLSWGVLLTNYCIAKEGRQKLRQRLSQGRKKNPRHWGSFRNCGYISYHRNLDIVFLSVIATNTQDKLWASVMQSQSWTKVKKVKWC